MVGTGTKWGVQSLPNPHTQSVLSSGPQATNCGSSGREHRKQG